MLINEKEIQCGKSTGPSPEVVFGSLSAVGNRYTAASTLLIDSPAGALLGCENWAQHLPSGSLQTDRLLHILPLP